MRKSGQVVNKWDIKTVVSGAMHFAASLSKFNEKRVPSSLVFGS